MSGNICDFYDNEDDFEIALSQAVHFARTVWEKAFTTNVHEKYMLFGQDTILNKNIVNKINELQVSYEDRK